MKTTLLLTIAILFGMNLMAQTAGNLTFSIKTTEPTGNYTGSHVIALWIESSTGTFIKTKVKYAAAREQYLNVWKTKSNSNVVDAVTGSTINSHTTPITFTWNATNVSGAVVTDTDYKVWVQMSDANSNGPTTSCLFTKGTTPITNQTFTNVGNFTNMTLIWTPNTSAIDEVATSGVGFVSYPNPLQNSTTIRYHLEKEENVSLKIYDINGKLVKVLTEQVGDIGDNYIVWNADNVNGNKVQTGVYYSCLTVGQKSYSQKMIVTK